jgi:hypothetical protein
MHVRVKTVSGTEADIPHEEALRIAREFHHHVKAEDTFHDHVRERNLHILHKAHSSIENIVGHSIAHDEAAIKEAIYQKLPGFDRGQAEMLYELIERTAARHHQKIYNAE